MVLLASGTLTINPQFLQDIKDDNVHLRQLLKATSEALATNRIRSIRIRVLSDLLANLRDQLATHFSLEEFFGYFSQAIEVAPRLATQAQDLRDQHDDLYQTISEIANDTECLLYNQTARHSLYGIALRYQAFYDQLQKHEEMENELIMAAFYDDIGEGD